jgi:hypothetical protein
MNSDELTGGRWVRSGGVTRFVPDDPAAWAIKRQAPLVEDHTADEVAEMLIGVLQGLLSSLDSIPIRSHHSCPDCGCLLRVPHELCPACAIGWCRQQEVRASWHAATVHYRPHEEGAAA